MSDAELQRIVAEVVRRLLEAERSSGAARVATELVAAPVVQKIIPTTSLSGIGGTSGLPLRAPDFPNEASIQTTRVSQIACGTDAQPRSRRASHDPCAAWRVSSDTLACDDRLLTLGKFAGGLDGVRRLVIAPKAVVTPSLREELNRRGIEVDRRAAGRSPAAPPQGAVTIVQPTPVDAGRLLVVEFDCPTRLSPAKTIAGAIGPVDHMACESLASGLAAVERHVSCGESLAIVLTRHAAAVACAANRRPCVRAAAVSSLDAVAMVLRSMAANVLTLDPGRHSRHTIQAIAKEFARSPRREIRSELGDVL